MSSVNERSEILDELLVLTVVAGHLYRSGEKHSADTIISVKEKLIAKLSKIFAEGDKEDTLRKTI